MKVIVTGGGTGGHIYPALAIADKFKEIDPSTEILYVGSRVGIEHEVVSKTDYEFRNVTARGIIGKTPTKLAKTASAVSKGISESKKIIKEFKPDVIIGTGGFVCVPMIIAGASLKVNTYLHEQNAYPGVANRMLERFVKNIFLGFPDAGKFFKHPEKHIEAGNPVRKSFFTTTKSEAREKLRIPSDNFMIFSFGGSIGSETINEISLELAKIFNGADDVNMIIGTGKNMQKDAEERLAKKNVEVKENIVLKGYIDNMDLHLLASDLVISRAGALSVAETNVAGKAAVLVPFPQATGNHQYYNAKSVADRGGAILVEEKDLVMDEIIAQVLSLKNNPEKLEKMSKASRECAPDRALDIICGKIIQDLK